MAKKHKKRDGIIKITGLLIDNGKTIHQGVDRLRFDDSMSWERIPVTLDFGNAKGSQIGEAKVFVKEDKMFADLKLKRDIISGHPAIGGQILERDKETGEITSFKLTSVSICARPNADPTILPIHKQLENNE